jgi:hypothetical protein
LRRIVYDCQLFSPSLSLTLRGGGGEEKGKECSLKEERRKIKTSAMRDRSKPKVHSNFPLHTVAEGGRAKERLQIEYEFFQLFHITYDNDDDIFYHDESGL